MISLELHQQSSVFFYPKKVVDLSKKEIVGVEVTTWENPINTWNKNSWHGQFIQYPLLVQNSWVKYSRMFLTDEFIHWPRSSRGMGWKLWLVNHKRRTTWHQILRDKSGELPTKIWVLQHVGTDSMASMAKCRHSEILLTWWLLLAQVNHDRNQSLPGLVNIQKAVEHGHWNSWFTHWTWWFSIVMLVYQRVILVLSLEKCWFWFSSFYCEPRICFSSVGSWFYIIGGMIRKEQMKSLVGAGTP